MTCRHCASHTHSSIMCYKKLRKPIKQMSQKHYKENIETKTAWFKANPPDENGEWECYLKISKDCLGKLNYRTLNREHVVSKVRAPELRFDINNIKPACQPCNKLKGSLSIKDLAKIFPHLRPLLDS